MNTSTDTAKPVKPTTMLSFEQESIAFFHPKEEGTYALSFFLMVGHTLKPFITAATITEDEKQNILMEYEKLGWIIFNR